MNFDSSMQFLLTNVHIKGSYVENDYKSCCNMIVKENTLSPWTKKKNNGFVKETLLQQETRNTYKVGIVIFTSRAITLVPKFSCPTLTHSRPFV